MTKPSTTHRILDAAEQLFAEHGYHPTSLRAITTAAEVNLAAVNYHFGSKKELVKAVMQRRLVPLNKLRMRLLMEVEEKAKQQKCLPDVRELIAAFIRPTIAFRNSSQGARNFIILVSRSLSEPDATVRSVFLEQVEPLFAKLFGLLNQSLPHLTKEVVYLRLLFLLGSLNHTMHMVDKVKPPFPEAAPEALDSVLEEEFLAFATSGMKA